MKTNKMLVVVIVLQGLTLLGQWGAPGASTIPAARAELPNPGERQIAILDEVKATNARLDRLLDLLSSGNLQVKVVKDVNGQ